MSNTQTDVSAAGFEALCNTYGRACQAPVTTFCWSFAPYNMVTGFVDHEAEGYNFAAWRDNNCYTTTGKLDSAGWVSLISWLAGLTMIGTPNTNSVAEVMEWLEADNLSNLQSDY